MKTIRLCVLVLLALVSVFSFAPPVAGQDAAAPAKIDRSDYGETRFGPFFITNCIWGRGRIADYEQFVYKAKADADFPVGWKWRWPEANVMQVKAYPNIAFGRDPWHDASTVSWLPRRIGDIDELTVSYDVARKVTGKYNLSFDLWITKTPGKTDPPEPNISREIMIWLDYSADKIPAFWYVRNVTIDGETYRFCRAEKLKTENYVRDYLGFLKVTPEYAGETRIHAFLKFLLENKYLTPAEYFRNIALGNEVYYGFGETVVNRYSIRFKAGEAQAAVGTIEETGRAAALRLTAAEARLKTTAWLKLETIDGVDDIGWWTSLEDEISWRLAVPADGEYRVTATVSCARDTPGSLVRLDVGGRSLTFAMPDTGEWSEFRDLAIGTLSLKAGAWPVTVKAVNVSGPFVGNLRALVFTGVR